MKGSDLLCLNLTLLDYSSTSFTLDFVMEIVSDAKLTHKQLSKVKKEGEDLPITKQMYFNIKTKQTKRKERTNGRAHKEEHSKLVKNFIYKMKSHQAKQGL